MNCPHQNAVETLIAFSSRLEILRSLFLMKGKNIHMAGVSRPTGRGTRPAILVPP